MMIKIKMNIMNKLLKCAFFLLFVEFYIKSNQILNGTLVTINGEPILLSDINESKMYLQYSKMDKKEDIKDEDILDKLIRNKLIKSHYKKLLEDPNIKGQIEVQLKYVTKAITDQAYDILSTYFKGDEKSFYNEIGCNVEDYIDNNVNIQKEQMITSLLLQKIVNNDSFSPKKLKEFYDNMSVDEKNEKIKSYKNSYQISEIVVINKESEEVKKKLEEVKLKIKENPNDFDNIINKYSNEDIYLGDIDIFDYDSPLCFYVSKLKENEISDVINIDNTYYILKCNKKDKNIRNISCLTLYNNEYDNDENIALNYLKSIKNDILDKKISWNSAVKKYSQSDDNKNFDGVVFNKNGEEILFDEDLSKNEMEIISKMNIGDISDPFIIEKNGIRYYKIILLRNKKDKDDVSFFNNFNILKDIYNSKISQDLLKSQTDKLLLKEDICFDLGYDVCRKYVEKYKLI